MESRSLGLVACICEGQSERAIIDLLLEHECLIFDRTDMLEEEVLKCRSARDFQKRYLNKTMDEKVTVYRILDSRKENFNITGPYKNKIDRVVNVITAPEIEMIIIHAENRYNDYSRKRLKPSEYVSQQLEMKNMKSYKAVKNYFRDIEKLKRAIWDYHSKARIKDDTIYKLLLKK